jgi:hypothetical protein
MNIGVQITGQNSIVRAVWCPIVGVFDDPETQAMRTTQTDSLCIHFLVNKLPIG